jgi:hypothetical protein
VPVSSWVTQALVPNPYAVSWLAWLAEPAVWLALNSDLVIVIGVFVLCARFVTADAADRARMRFLFVVVVVAIPVYTAWATVARVLGIPEGSALGLVLTSLIAFLIPVAIIYGILRHRVFDLDLVVRKSVAYGATLLLIAASYAVIAATPGLMLGNRIPVTLAVVITIAAAIAFQPLRRRLESAVSRKLFGDRVRQFQLLKNLGTTMEQTAELDELLPRLATAVRDGLGASWVRVRLREADGSWLDEPVGVAGEVSDDSAAGADLVHASEQVGRIDLGPKPGGYAAADLELLTTVPHRPQRQSPMFGSRPSSRRGSRSSPPLESDSLPRRTPSDVGLSATCTMGSSRRSWLSSQGCGWPATGSVETNSPLTS